MDSYEVKPVRFNALNGTLAIRVYRCNWYGRDSQTDDQKYTTYLSTVSMASHLYSHNIVVGMTISFENRAMAPDTSLCTRLVETFLPTYRVNSEAHERENNKDLFN
jgi:hypothetical protein